MTYDKLGGDVTDVWASQCQLGTICNCTSGTGGSTGGRITSDGSDGPAPAQVVDLNANFTNVKQKNLSIININNSHKHKLPMKYLEIATTVLLITISTNLL